MILITGGAGYIGSAATLELADRGYETLVVDNFSKGHRELVFSGSMEEGDIRDEAFLERVFSSYPIDGVLHFAALSLVGESMSNPMLYYSNNVEGSIKLLNAAVKHGVGRFVLSSTAAVYGYPEEQPITEDAPKVPTNVYGETKLFIENMLQRLNSSCGLGSVSLRYFNAAGADVRGRTGEDHTPETHLIPIVLEAALGKRKHVAVFGSDYPTPDGTCVRDYIHINDLARAHVMALEALAKNPAMCCQLNLGNGAGYSVRQVIDATRKVTGRDIRVISGDRRPGDPPSLVASALEAHRALDWYPEICGVEEIIQTAYDYYVAKHK